MAFSRVQEAHDFSFTTAAKTFTSSIGAGNLLVAWMNDFNTGAFGTISVTDTLGNSWNQVQTSLAGGSGRVAMFWAIANGAGSDTVTFHTTTSFSFPIIQIVEFTGGPASPLETTVQATGSSTTPQVNITVTGTADLIVAAVVPTSSSTTSPGAGFNSMAGTNNNHDGIYAIETGSGTFTPSWSMNISGGWAVVAAAFTLNAAPPPGNKSVTVVFM